jgi:hypothetical protein
LQAVAGATASIMPRRGSWDHALFEDYRILIGILVAPEFIPGFAKGLGDGNRFNGFSKPDIQKQTVETVLNLC